MSIIYREISEKQELFQCFELQQNVFGLTELQTIPMLILNALGNNPSRSGLLVGAYDTEKERFIGFILSLCTQKPNTMYVVAAGVLPEFQNTRPGLLLLQNTFKIAKDVGFDFLEFYFNPLKPNLGRLYINYYKLKGVRFTYDAFPDYENSHRVFGIGHTIHPSKQEPHKNTDHEKIPLLKEKQSEYNSDVYLLAIPQENEDTSFFFHILDKLINQEGYYMDNCITLKHENRRLSYYVLQKGDINHLFE